MIAERAHTGDVGVALATYLSEDDEIDESARIDVRRQLDSVYSRLAPDLMPAGRWVSPHELNVAAGKMAAAERTCELWFAAQRHHHAVWPTFLDLILSWDANTVSGTTTIKNSPGTFIQLHSPSTNVGACTAH